MSQNENKRELTIANEIEMKKTVNNNVTSSNVRAMRIDKEFKQSIESNN